MDAKIVNLVNLFEEDVSYRIPQFQRPYAWAAHQWEPLWDDVRNVAERCLAGGKVRPHFMGAIVLQQQKHSTGEVTKRLVVDGQQRLTTLQLLIKASQLAFQAQDETERADRFQSLITNPRIYWGDEDANETKIRQSNQNDQKAFQEAILLDYHDEPRPPWAINLAFNFFKTKITAWLENAPANRAYRAGALEETLTKYFLLAAIDVETDERPHIIFETLNARGEPLKQSDLVKNTVMYEANVTDDAEKATKLWGLFNDDWWREATHEGRLSRIHIDRFLNYWIMMRTLKDITADRVASEFRNYIEKWNTENQQSTIESLTKQIKEAGLIYRDMEKGQLLEIQTFLKRMKVLELGVVTPVLLWLYTSDVPLQKRSRSVEALESYLVRRMICGFQSQGLNKLFISILEKLGDSNPSNPDDVIINTLQAQTVDNRIWPNDRILYESLINQPFKITDARRKMVLEAIELNLRSDKSEPLGLTDKLTLEHVMPKQWEKHWPIPDDVLDGTEAEIARHEAINNIGNLTLTTGKLNRSLSNGPWTEKRGELHKHSSLLLNKTLLDDAADAWDESAIQKRNERLAHEIVQIWPSPENFGTSSTNGI